MKYGINKHRPTRYPQRLAFQQTYGVLHNRIMAFSTLSFEKLDRGSLQNASVKSATKLQNRNNQI